MQNLSDKIGSVTARDCSVALASPFCWPEVRRGGERMHADLAEHLIADGYDVTFVSSAPQDHVDVVDLPVGLKDRIIIPRKDGFSFRHYFTPAHEFRLRATRALRNLNADVFYALTYFDAAAFLSAKGQARLVVHSIGVPNAQVYRRVPWDGRMLRNSILKADRLFVLSRFAADQTHRHYGRMPEVLPPPVTVKSFAPKTAKPERPRILFCGDANEPRKGADVLVRAVNRMTEQRGEIELVFSGAISPSRQHELEDLAGPRTRVTCLGTGSRDDLPGLYRSASVLVLPSQWEAFGLVLVEALACGTPVVAARNGGGADIVNSPDIGTLFDAEADTPEIELADAILQSLEKADSASTISACRARAMNYDWSVLGSQYRRAIA